MLTDASSWYKLLLSNRGILEWGYSVGGEAEAKRGTTAMIVASEKCIAAKRVEELVTVELVVCNE